VDPSRDHGISKKLNGRGDVYAIIASAFPGLFSQKEFASVDVRLLLFWKRQALIQKYSNEIQLIEMIRIANHATFDKYEEILRGLRARLEAVISGKPEQEVRAEAWADLADLGGA